MMNLVRAAIALLLILPQSVQDLVTAVSLNAQQLRDQLPDLVCSEKVTSTTFESGNVDKQKVVESLFSVQKSREHREVLAIDGKPAKKNTKMPDLPLDIGGTFSFHVLVTFLPQYSNDYEFVFDANPQEAGRWVVRFATTNQSKLSWDLDGERAAKDTGKAWIDASSMQVARLERNLLNLPRRFSLWKVTVEQAPVVVVDRQYWLPQTFRTEVTERDPKKTASFVAEYSNCRKFTTEISVSPVRP